MSPRLDALIDLLGAWRQAFRQQRSFERALRLSLAQILTPGQRLISRLICSTGRQDQDWSGDYKLFSRSPWQARRLFRPVIERCLEHCHPGSYVVLAGDFTHLPKTGRRIPNVCCIRDPMSAPYHVNLIQGTSLFPALGPIAPLPQSSRVEPTAKHTDLFHEVPVVKKPGRKASPAEQLAYRRTCKKRPTSQSALQEIKTVRAEFDHAGAGEKTLLIALGWELL